VTSPRATEGRARDALGLALIAGALGVLGWACRGAPLGVPVADDYLFLARARFQHPLEWFDSMGAAWYWRPLSRQLYYSTLSSTMLAHPAAVAALHFALLAALALVLYRLARRVGPPELAAAFATFPVLAEPARALVTWPSGAQHLVAMLCVALAVDGALARRPWRSALALLLGLLAHEIAALGIVVVAAIALARRDARARWAGVLAALVPAALWLAGRALAARHGMRLPPGGDALHFAWGRVPETWIRAFVAQLDLEPWNGRVRIAALAAYAVLVALAALRLAADPGARARLRRVAPAAWGGLAVFVAGALPFAGLLPDWNGWHVALPGIGLGLALAVLLGSAWPALALGVVALRVALLVGLPGAQPVTGTVPRTTSLLSFERVSRLQRVVGSTRTALTARFARLPEGASVGYWSIPLLSEVGFAESRALEVWYADSTLRWRTFGATQGLDRPFAAVVGYNLPSPAPAVVIEPAALKAARAAREAWNEGRWDRADSLLGAAVAAQHPEAFTFEAAMWRNRARIAAARGDTALALERLARSRELDPGATAP
jgi:hypothetical protein